MKRFGTLAQAFVREEDAASMIEYALLAVLIAMVVAVAALTLGHAVSTEFANIANCVNQPTTGGQISQNCTAGATGGGAAGGFGL
jgi:pilus assembly protein Flp/PilA